MSIDPNEVLRQAREESDKLAREQRRQNALAAAETRRLKIAREALIDKYLRPATINDYTKWLKGYILRGMTVSLVYQQNFPRRNFFVATRDIPEMPRLCGALAVNIIVPEGVQAPKLTEHMPYGHSVLYFMDGFEIYGGKTPPVNADISF